MLAGNLNFPIVSEGYKSDQKKILLDYFATHLYTQFLRHMFLHLRSAQLNERGGTELLLGLLSGRGAH
jgi:hypothetical protein